tara:strand:- start:928 stop:1263 length:336 start_codon:yes stop_codon:yes gene_type:complete
MNMQQMLGESGRTMSNMDRSMSQNEPRFEERPPELQIFTLNSSIDNLMKTYEMMVRNQDFQGAQQIADQIDQIEQQKIGIQNQQSVLGETGRTMSNQDRQQIDDILQSIAK